MNIPVPPHYHHFALEDFNLSHSKIKTLCHMVLVCVSCWLVMSRTLGWLLACTHYHTYRVTCHVDTLRKYTQVVDTGRGHRWESMTPPVTCGMDVAECANDAFVKEHLGCFPFLTIMYKAPVNSRVLLSRCSRFHFSGVN